MLAKYREAEVLHGPQHPVLLAFWWRLGSVPSDVFGGSNGVSNCIVEVNTNMNKCIAIKLVASSKAGMDTVLLALS